MPGTVADKFAFTVRDPAVAAKINANIGERLVAALRAAQVAPQFLLRRYRVLRHRGDGRRLTAAAARWRDARAREPGTGTPGSRARSTGGRGPAEP